MGDFYNGSPIPYNPSLTRISNTYYDSDPYVDIHRIEKWEFSVSINNIILPTEFLWLEISLKDSSLGTDKVAYYAT